MIEPIEITTESWEFHPKNVSPQLKKIIEKINEIINWINISAVPIDEIEGVLAIEKLKKKL